MDLRLCSSTLLTLLLVTQSKGTPTYLWRQPDCGPGVDYGYDYYQGPSYQEILQTMITETLSTIRDIIRITSKAVKEELMYIAQKLYEPSGECEPDDVTNNDPDLGDFSFSGYPVQPMVHPIPFSEGDNTKQNVSLIYVGEYSEFPNSYSEGYEGPSSSANISLETDNYSSTSSSQDTSTSSEVNTEAITAFPNESSSSNMTYESLSPTVSTPENSNSSIVNVLPTSTSLIENKTEDLNTENEVKKVNNDPNNHSTLRKNTTYKMKEPKK